MNITEREVFDFVFSQNNISPEKLEVIQNSNFLLDEVNFYIELKNSFYSEISENLKNKLASRVPAYKPFFSVMLFPVKHQSDFSHKKVSDVTPENGKTIFSNTFVDSKKQYIIRLMQSENQTKVYTFNTMGKILNNYKIILHPDESHYFCKISNDTLFIDKMVNPQSVELVL